MLKINKNQVISFGQRKESLFHKVSGSQAAMTIMVMISFKIVIQDIRLPPALTVILKVSTGDGFLVSGSYEGFASGTNTLVFAPFLAAVNGDGSFCTGNTPGAPYFKGLAATFDVPVTTSDITSSVVEDDIVLPDST